MKQYLVDAFTEQLFHGNQAAICILDEWLSEEQMMNITKENNFSETAFAVKEGQSYHLRWFTPGGEIDLCGHATLACAFVLLKFYIPQESRVVFSTLSGELTVEKKGELLEMQFPAYTLQPVPVTAAMEEALGARPIEAYKGRDLLCVFDAPETVIGMKPALEKVKALDGLLLHCTARGTAHDCVSRSFAPKLNVAEDPVCGSGHCHIVPYWAQKLSKKEIVAYQASERSGVLYCNVDEEKIYMAGNAVLYAVSELNI